jgi:hypothetical protein
MTIIDRLGKLLASKRQHFEPSAAEPVLAPKQPMHCGTPYIWMGWVPPNRSKSGKWEPPEETKKGAPDE